MNGKISTAAASVLSAELLDRLRPQSASPLSKVRQLYLNLYQVIEAGELPFGTRLPSSRQLSQQLGLGRNTVIGVYEQLVSEGLIVSDGRRGTRVSRQVEKELVNDSAPLQLSVRSCQLVSRPSAYKDLTPGEPDTSLFPQSVWRKALALATRNTKNKLGYQEGSLDETQEAIARYLAIYRSLQVEPKQIVVTSGTRQSLNLAAALFTDPADVAWMECPGYLGGVDAFKQWGLELNACQIDQSGLVLPAPTRRQPRIVYLTPCFQYPLGMPLSAERRQALLDLSRKHSTVLFEDDYDSEFRDDSQPRPSLAGDAQGATVLNAGTFSKLLFPAMRIGWLVVPQNISAEAHRCLKAIGGGNNTVAQMVVTELLNNGSIARHLRRARQIYGQRCLSLVKALSECELLEPVDQMYGSLSLVLRLKESVSISLLEKALVEQRLGAVALERLDWKIAKPTRCKAIVIGLGNVDTISIPDTVKRLSLAVQSVA